jgi:hypothetical protein
MINPQKGIDLMNNTSIIIKILFVVTIFQHSPLTRRVFYNNIRRERGQQHQARERTTSSTTSWNTDWRIYKSSEVFFFSSSTSSFTENGMISSSASTWISIKLIHHHHSTEAGHIITARSWHIITARGWHIITTIKLAHHHSN